MWGLTAEHYVFLRLKNCTIENANFFAHAPILLKHGSFQRYWSTCFRSTLTSEAPDLQESGTVLEVSKMTLWRHLMKYHFTCTDFAQTWLILKVWKYSFQIYFNIGGTPPPGVGNRPRSLQNEALETAIEISLLMHRFCSNMAQFKGMEVLISDPF